MDNDSRQLTSPPGPLSEGRGGAHWMPGVFDTLIHLQMFLLIMPNAEPQPNK